MQNTFKCGHAGEVPEHMGRGQARINRIAKHFSGNCPDCRRKALEATARRLVALTEGLDANGKRNTRPYTEEEVAAFVARHM